LFELPEECFPKLYFMRWPVETKYDVVKNKLPLENFSGCPKNVILQEFWASMHPAGMAAAAEDEANAAIRKKRAGKDNKYEYAANLNQIIIAIEIEKSVVPIRPGRSVERPLTPRKTKYHHNRKSHA
ncbi:MAG: hypothetical protein LBC93_00415, partial [Synergistaceae bacterium]|nr:hypothetical protein [Synergistaceae bacterium]